MASKALFTIACAFLLFPALSVAAQDDTFDVEQAYQATCFACHGTGAAHSTEVGAQIEWEIRMEKGMETLIQNTIAGLNGIMPPRGLCATCSDDQLKAIVEFMLDSSL
jgi:cytochrome c5